MVLLIPLLVGALLRFDSWRWGDHKKLDRPQKFNTKTRRHTQISTSRTISLDQYLWRNNEIWATIIINTHHHHWYAPTLLLCTV